MKNKEKSVLFVSFSVEHDSIVDNVKTSEKAASNLTSFSYEVKVSFN